MYFINTVLESASGFVYSCTKRQTLTFQPISNMDDATLEALVARIATETVVHGIWGVKERRMLSDNGLLVQRSHDPDSPWKASTGVATIDRQIAKYGCYYGWTEGTKLQDVQPRVVCEFYLDKGCEVREMTGTKSMCTCDPWGDSGCGRHCNEYTQVGMLIITPHRKPTTGAAAARASLSDRIAAMEQELIELKKQLVSSDNVGKRNIHVEWIRAHGGNHKFCTGYGTGFRVGQSLD
jgi:hypothetical protein